VSLIDGSDGVTERESNINNNNNDIDTESDVIVKAADTGRLIILIHNFFNLNNPKMMRIYLVFRLPNTVTTINFC